MENPAALRGFGLLKDVGMLCRSVGFRILAVLLLPPVDWLFLLPKLDWLFLLAWLLLLP